MILGDRNMIIWTIITLSWLFLDHQTFSTVIILFAHMVPQIPGVYSTVVRKDGCIYFGCSLLIKIIGINQRADRTYEVA